MTEPALLRLARFVAEDPLEADAPTLAVLRDGVIDTLGCIHVGTRTETATRARAAVRAMEAAGPIRVIGTTMTASRPQAAFLNAVAGHALDFDDWEVPGNTHPSVVMVPALLALAGPETTGAELARAYLAGFEVIARLGEALNFAHYDRGWHSTATLGAIGAAAAAARLTGCDTERTAHAMSFAISAAAGYTCQFGSHAKLVQAGFAARAGVEAASLAAVGLTAQAHVLDHPRGMEALMAGVGRVRLDAALGRLGAPLALAEHGLVLKPWPSCGYTHRIMTCARRLRGRVDQSRIARIDLHLPDFHAAVIPFRQPRSRSEALFSPSYVAAMGLVRGDLTLADLETATWEAPDIAEPMVRVAVHPFAPRRPDLNYAEEDPDRMVVTLGDGTRLEETCAFPTGSPQAPMSEAELWSKFAANAGPGLASRIERLATWPAAPRIVDLLSEGGAVS